jgi:hypothetical protein
MADFTDVSSTLLEPGDPIRSVDIIAIKDNTLFLYDAAFSFPIIDTQVFNTSGTWSRPSFDRPEATSIIALIVGGGGGGAGYVVSSGGATGGTTGAVVLASVGTLLVPATGSVVIGAGGASRTASSSFFDGLTGGLSTFTLGDSVISATGGTGGNAVVGSSFGPAATNGTSSGLWKDRINFGKMSRGASSTVVYPIPPFGGGGGNYHQTTTQYSINREAGPSFDIDGTNILGAGGDGGEFTGGNGGAWGGGGGGVSRNTGTLTTGAGGSGGAIIFTVLGFPSTALFNLNNTQIP